jgi:preprotein translocase subunit SecA
VAASLARGAASLSTGNGANGGNGRTIGTAGAAVGVGADAKVPAAAAVGGSAILRGGPPAPPTTRPMRASLGDQPITSEGAGPAVGPGGPKPGFTPSGERIGRNDPCWCGSGAKYKKCHGR